MNTVTAKRSVAKRAASDSSDEPQRHKIKSGDRKTHAQTVKNRAASGSRKPKRSKDKPGPTPRVQNPQQAASRLKTIEEPLDDGLQFTIAHAFILLGYLVGIALVLVFGLDLLVEIPFDRASVSYDIANVVCGLTLVYLSWNCQRDLK